MNQTPPEQTSPTPPAPRKKRRVVKAFLITLISLLILIALAAWGVWVYLRSENFNRYIAEQIKTTLQQYGLRGEIGGTELSIQGQTAKLGDLKIYNQQTGRLIASVKRIELKVDVRDPWAMRTSREIALQKLDLAGLDVYVEIDEQGRTNFEGLRTPPKKESALTFDYSQLLMNLSESAFHYKDRSHQLEADLTGLKIAAQPTPGKPAVIGMQLESSGGRFSYEARELKLGRLDLTARVSETGADLERIKLDSSLGEVQANGRLDDWKAVRYGLDLETKLKLDEVSRVFLPKVAMTGLASNKARLEGQGSDYKIKGDLNCDDATVERTRLRQVRAPQIDFNGQGKQFDFTVKEFRAQSATYENVAVGGIAIKTVQGDYRNDRTKIAAPGANVGTVEWPESKLSNLTLANLTADFNNADRAFRYQIKASANLGQGELSKIAFNNATAQATYDNAALKLDQIKAGALGGNVTGEFTLPVARGAAARTTAAFTDLETKELFAMLAAAGAAKPETEIPLTGKLSGEGEISFIGANPRSINGAVKAHFTGQANEQTDAIPLTGEVSVTVAHGVFSFDQLDLSTDVTKVTATGQLALDGASDVRVSLTTTQAEQLLQIARSIEAARPYLAEYEPQLIGDFKFEGNLRTSEVKSKNDPINFSLEGDLNAATVGLRDALLGALSGRVLLSPQEIRVEKGLITAANGGSVKFDLATPLDAKAASGKLDAVIDKFNLETLLAAAGAPSASQFVVGDVTGEAKLTGLPASPNGAAQIKLENGKIADQPAEVAAAKLTFDSQVATLESFEVRLPQSHVTAGGQLNLSDYTFNLKGQADQISLKNLAETFELKDTQIEGVATADLTVAGKIITGKQPDLDWESLNVNLRADGKGVKVNGRATGDLRLGARTSAGGRVDFSLLTDILNTSPAADPTEKPEVIRGSIELRQPGRPIQIESNLVDQDLAPILAIFAPDLNQTIAGKISGKLQLSGPTAGPSVDAQGKSAFEQMRGGLTLSQISIRVAEIPVTIETPAKINLEAMQLKVENTRINGQGLDLNFGGTFGLKGDAGMDFSLNGKVDLNRLPVTTPDLLLNGVVEVNAKLKGTAEKPDLSGKIDVAGFGLTSRNLPFFVSDGVGSIAFSGEQVLLQSFKANANDGTLEANGFVKLVQLRPAEWKYNIKADNATVDYQEVSANVSGALTLTGTPQGQTLAGTINIPQAEYAPGIDLDNLLSTNTSGLSLGGFGGEGGVTQGLGIPPVNLNVRVEARDSLIIRNEQINAVGAAVVNLTGTLSDPNLSGRIETNGGSVRFRGQRYEITAGALDLPPNNDTPQLNLQAEGAFSGYRVTIGFIGPVDNLDLKLISEPALVRDEIIALITTGRTESGTLTSQDPLRSGVGAAASLLSSGFISKPTEQLLGLSRFQIDPIIRPNANPAARLTVGQQLSRNIYLSYSTNLATEQDQTALAEYTFSNRFSALATFTQGGSAARQGGDEGVFTLELRGRKRFSLGFSDDSLAAAATAGVNSGNPNEALNRIVRPKLPLADVQVAKVPELKLSNQKLRELLPVMTQGFSRSLARLGERRLREYLQEQGYFFAEVNFRCEPGSCNPTPAKDSGANSPNAANAAGAAGDAFRVFYEMEPNTLYDLKEIRIEGTQLIKTRDIADELQSQVASRVGGIPFLKDLPIIGGTVRGLTSTDRLKNDEEAIRRRLNEIGFRNARVKSRLAVKPDNDDLIVIFDVEEGLQSDVAGVSLRGNTILSAEELRRVVPIQSGEAFSYTRAKAGVQQIKQLYAQQGFFEVAAELDLVNTDEDSVLLVYKIDEGARAIVSDIQITGLTKTGPGWVRRYFDFKQGEILTPAKIRRTQRDLYATNAFREVTLNATPMGGDDGSAHRVTLKLTEAKPLLFVYGLGYSTDDGVRGLIEVANTNVGGSLDSLTLRLRASRREQFSQLAFTDLRPFGTRLPTTVSIFYNRTANLRPFVRRRVLTPAGEKIDDPNDNGFGLQRFAAFIQTERKLSDRTSLRFRYNLERAKLFDIDQTKFPDTDITRNERAIRLGMLSIGLTSDNRDSAINPTRGQLISADHSIAASFLGGNESFNKFFGTYQRYKTLDSDFPLVGRFLGNSTLAFSARIGLAATFRDADRNNDQMISESEKRLPISERFFSGGATTLRGFRFETAGPQAVLNPVFDPKKPMASLRCDNPDLPPNTNCQLPTLVPIGGDALAILNFELRYPLTQRLRLVPYYDVGNVFRRVGDMKLSNLTHTVGLGLRINTPLGPVGVDYGFLIDAPAYLTDPSPFTGARATLRQPRGAIHIRLGQSF